MDLTPTLVNAALVATVGAVLALAIRGQLNDLKVHILRLDARIDRLEDRVERGFERIEQRFERIEQRFERIEQRFERADGEFANLRSDLTHIALAVGARPRPQTG